MCLNWKLRSAVVVQCSLLASVENCVDLGSGFLGILRHTDGKELPVREKAYWP